MKKKVFSLIISFVLVISAALVVYAVANDSESHREWQNGNSGYDVSAEGYVPTWITEALDGMAYYVDAGMIEYEYFIHPDGTSVLDIIIVSEKVSFLCVDNDTETGIERSSQCCNYFWNRVQRETRGPMQLIGTLTACYRQRVYVTVFCRECGRILSQPVPFYVG